MFALWATINVFATFAAPAQKLLGATPTGVRASCCKHVSDGHGHERLASAHFGDDGNRVGLLEPLNSAGDRDFLGGKRLSQKFSQDWRDRFAGCVESGEAG
jgi:hypothetical protein